MSTKYSEFFNKKVEDDTKKKVKAAEEAKKAVKNAEAKRIEQLKGNFAKLVSVLDKSLDGSLKTDGVDYIDKVYNLGDVKILSYMYSFNSEESIGDFMGFIKNMENIRKFYNGTKDAEKIPEAKNVEIRVSDSYETKFIIITFDIDEKMRMSVITESEKRKIIVSMYSKDIGISNLLNFKIINTMYFGKNCENNSGEKIFERNGFKPKYNPNLKKVETVRDIAHTIGEIIDLSLDEYFRVINRFIW